jgi:ferredoxin-NADP reductase
VYVASDPAELAFREELAATGARVVVFTREEPKNLPAHWTWAQGARLDAAALEANVADIASRHAFISGPPRLIADLAPALQKARNLTTDAFAGY